MAGTLTLIVVSFFSSILTVIIGMGGGILLSSIMSVFLPAPALVLTHGMVQQASIASGVCLALET